METRKDEDRQQRDQVKETCSLKAIEDALDEADAQAEATDQRYSHDELFNSIREGLRRA